MWSEDRQLEMMDRIHCHDRCGKRENRHEKVFFDDGGGI